MKEGDGGVSRRGFLAYLGGSALLMGLGAACESIEAPAASPPPAGPSAVSTPSPAASAPPQVGQASPAVTRPPVSLNYGNVSSGPTELGIHMAEKQGFFDDYGVTLNHVVLQTSTNMADALVGKSIDVTGVSPPSLVVAYAKGATDLTLIGIEQEKATYTLISAVDVTTYAGLKGKTVGISSPGDGLTVLTQELLAKHGLSDSDYSVVSLGASGQRFAAIQTGQVQAVCITQPFDFQLEHQGYNRLGDVIEVAPQFSFGGLGSRRSWVSENRDTATRFLAGALRGQQFLVDPANRDPVTQEMQSYLNMSADDAQATYDLLITQLNVFPVDLTPSSEGLQAVIDVSVKLGDVTPPGPSQAELLDLDALHAAQQLVGSSV